MNMKSITVEALNQMTASNAPTPGGGSISAMAGAFAAALSSMVANLTIDKKGYEEYQQAMRDIVEKAEPLRLSLLDDIQKDSNSFDAYMEALKLPKSTDEEKAIRHAAMQNAMKKAIDSPLGIAKKALSIMPLCMTVVAHGNANARTDGLVGMLLARAALRGALYNVKINLPAIKDEAYVADIKAECARIDQEAFSLEEKITAQCPDLA